MARCKYLFFKIENIYLVYGATEMDSDYNPMDSDYKPMDSDYTPVDTATDVNLNTADDTKVEFKEDPRYTLITRNLAEVMGEEDLRDKLVVKDTPVAYWGVAPTRSPSIGYLIPLLKIKDLVDANIWVKIFIADLHSFMDKGHDWFDRTPARVEYYKFLLTTLLDQLNVSPEKYEIICGSDVQLDRKYVTDLLLMTTRISVNQAKKAGSEVVKQDKDPKLSSLIYPLMQVLDETVLSADIQLGGLDQRKIFALARDSVEQFGYDKCTYLMNPLLPSLGKPGAKMSSSDPMSKVDFFDTPEIIKDKLRRAYCVDGSTDLTTNSCLAFCCYVGFPLYGQIGEYKTYDAFLADWKDKKFLAQQLKAYVVEIMCKFIAPVREKLLSNKALFDAAFGE